MSVKVSVQGIEVIGKMVVEVINNEIRAQERKQQILESLAQLRSKCSCFCKAV